MQVRYVDVDPVTHSTVLLAVAVPVAATAADGHLAPLYAALHGWVERLLTTGDLRGRRFDDVVL
jgi:hypothetical protein